ncbi:MAG: SO_0444 family Cu/Zn efflux transporter [Planctomycetota bacterium]|nr:SO_0444 family Cu/Zn efflux transporter [Planctomycetota bacterium]
MIEAFLNISASAWLMLGQMAPYLLLGFLAAGVLSVLIPPAWVERHLGGSGPWPVIKATLFGIPLPLCSCGVIPVAAGLRRQGAGRGATAAFLASTPQTGADSILATYGMMGPVFAVVRPLVALVSGLLCGAAVALTCRNRSDGGGGGAASDGQNAGGSDRPACATPSVCCSSDVVGGGGRVIRALKYGFVTLPGDMARPLLIGLGAAGIIAALVPGEIFATFSSVGGIAGMLAAMLLAIPMYVCATGAIPVAAALVAKGVTPGAALVFLIAGPATNAATIAAAVRLLGRRGAAIYLAVLSAVALAAGILLDFLSAGVGMAGADMCCPAEVLPLWANHVSAAVLLALLLAGMLAGAIARRSGARAAAGGGAIAVSSGPCREMDAKTAGQFPPDISSGAPEDRGNSRISSLELKIAGMTCRHCAEAVRVALAACPGVGGVRVDIGTGVAEVWGDRIETPALVSAVRRAGFEAEAI